MVHAGCVSVAGIHSSRTWTSTSFESAGWNESVHRPQFILSSEEFRGNGVRPQRKKSPLQEARTRGAASSRTASIPSNVNRTHYLYGRSGGGGGGGGGTEVINPSWKYRNPPPQKKICTIAWVTLFTNFSILKFDLLCVCVAYLPSQLNLIFFLFVLVF